MLLLCSKCKYEYDVVTMVGNMVVNNAHEQVVDRNLLSGYY